MSDEAGSQPAQGESIERLEGILFGGEEREPTEPVAEEYEHDETGEAPTPDDEPGDDDPGEIDETEPKPGPEPKRHRVKVNGKEYEVSEQELINGYQRNEDYVTRNEGLRREQEALQQARQQFEQNQQLQQAVMHEYATAVALDNQLAQYAQIDWARLYDNDPAQAAKLDNQMRTLERQRDIAFAKVQNGQHQAAQIAQQQMNEQAEHGRRELPKLIPGWKPEMATEIRDFGISLGIPAQELGNVVNPLHVKVLWMASQYAKLQGQKPAINKRVAEAPRPVKPGAASAATSGNTAKDQALRQTLRKSGRVEDAAALIMQRFKL